MLCKKKQQKNNINKQQKYEIKNILNLQWNQWHNQSINLSEYFKYINSIIIVRCFCKVLINWFSI